MKFSIVIPVYNVEKYIDKCLNSIINQTYKNFEVIIVNDGTKDNSQQIIDEYVKKDNRFKSYKKENGGLSDARNYGIKYATGDYLVLIDSDDYIDLDYLERVNQVLISNKNIDLIKIKIRLVDDLGNLIRYEQGFTFSGRVCFDDLVKLEFFEPAWSYIYNLKFWKKNKFQYVKGMIHEDFGLTPEIVMKSKYIYYLDYYGYNYVQRQNSIMSSDSREKRIKKAYDMLHQYDRLIDIKYKQNDRLYRSFISNAVIFKSKTLDKNDKKLYIKELKKRKVLDNIINDTFIRKLKKLYYKLMWRFI